MIEVSQVVLHEAHEPNAIADLGDADISPDAVAGDGPAQVLVGAHGAAVSPLYAGDSLNYLAVRLRAGESWTYQPAVNHTVGSLSLSSGRVRLPESVEAVNSPSSSLRTLLLISQRTLMRS